MLICCCLQRGRHILPLHYPWSPRSLGGHRSTSTSTFNPYSNMHKHDDNQSQLICPQYTYKSFKRSVIRFFQRLGSRCRNATTRLDIHVLAQEGFGADSTTANTGPNGPHTQAQVRDAVAPTQPITTPDATLSGTFFQHAEHVNISGRPNFQNQISHVTNVYGGVTDDLEKLEKFVSFDAQFDSSVQDPERQCHPGTRENILKRLRDWVDDPNPTERIVWLYGPAGAGKSAIAQTIAHFHERPKIAATFFFFRSDVNRNDGNRLFTTLAYQLALSLPSIRGYIAHSLSERPDLPMTNVETQFKHLLAQPLEFLSADIIQQSAPVIVIDGVDECIDENLQQQFLKVIGSAVKDSDRFPLRFLIVSRPELHIEQAIGRFQVPILRIDLARLDDANRDIEKYLVYKFSCIASENGLESTWPGQEIIDDIVNKSSGIFIFAFLVIKFISELDNSPQTQLDIIRNLKPQTTKSPFALLDQLFLQILARVPEQDFLKRYLALLVTRISVSSDYDELYKDDAVLMHVSEKDLHAKLRRLRSLFNFETRIDMYHRSFLDFLHDSSRSSQYYIHKQRGMKRYMELLVDSLDQYVSTVIEQPDHANAVHFSPEFSLIISEYPPKIMLSVNEWQEVTQPLVNLQDKLLQLPNFTSTWDLWPCSKCTAFHLLRDLLHLRLLKGRAIDGVEFARQVRKRSRSAGEINTENTQNNDLDRILSSLFARLPETMENWLPSTEVISLICTILRFEHAETSRRVRSVSDGQKLVDLLDYAIHGKNTLDEDALRKATLLALDIFARVPILPLSLSINRNNRLHRDAWTYGGTIPIEILSQTMFAGKILDYLYVLPVLGLKEGKGYVVLTSNEGWKDMSAKQWRGRKKPSPTTAIQVIFQLAKVIQYLHSMDVVLNSHFGSHDVYLGSSLRPKIHCLCSTSRSLLDKYNFSREDNIFSFGYLFYELYFGIDTGLSFSVNSRRRIPKRPSAPSIPDYAWRLIERCCARDRKSRPTIDDVVKEMEGWK